MPKEAIISEARAARQRLWLATDDVSAATRAAIAVTRAWQDAVRSPTVLTEVGVAPGLNEAIDVVEMPVAFEMKVSANNPHHEFYKDIFKVMAFNRSQTPRIETLVFLTDPAAVVQLQRGLGQVAMQAAAELGLVVELIAV